MAWHGRPPSLPRRVARPQRTPRNSTPPSVRILWGARKRNPKLNILICEQLNILIYTYKFPQIYTLLVDIHYREFCGNGLQCSLEVSELGLYSCWLGYIQIGQEWSKWSSRGSLTGWKGTFTEKCLPSMGGRIFLQASCRTEMEASIFGQCIKPMILSNSPCAPSHVSFCHRHSAHFKRSGHVRQTKPPKTPWSPKCEARSIRIEAGLPLIKLDLRGIKSTPLSQHDWNLQVREDIRLSVGAWWIFTLQLEEGPRAQLDTFRHPGFQACQLSTSSPPCFGRSKIQCGIQCGLV